MSFRKIIRAVYIDPDSKDEISEEMQGFSFQEVIRKFKGRDVTLYLDIYTDTDFWGWSLLKSELIGNTKTGVEQDDYWKAYDKIL